MRERMSSTAIPNSLHHSAQTIRVTQNIVLVQADNREIRHSFELPCDWTDRSKKNDRMPMSCEKPCRSNRNLSSPAIHESSIIDKNDVQHTPSLLAQ